VGFGFWFLMWCLTNRLTKAGRLKPVIVRKKL